MISLFLECLRGLVVGGLCIRQLSKLHISQRNVVENLRLVVAHAKSLVAEVAESECLEGAAQVSANDGDSAQVLIDHRNASPVARQLRLGAGGRVDRCRLVEVAPDLVGDSDDDQRLRDSSW